MKSMFFDLDVGVGVWVDGGSGEACSTLGKMGPFDPLKLFRVRLGESEIGFLRVEGC